MALATFVRSIEGNDMLTNAMWRPSLKRSRTLSPRLIGLVLTFLTVSAVAQFGLPGRASASGSSNVPVGVELPLTIDDGPIPDAVATGIDCTTATNCVAVGEFLDTIGLTHSMTLQLTGTTWTAAQELAPSGPPDYTFSELNAVSCVSTGNCVAVGSYRVNTEENIGYYAVETSGTWARGATLSLPSDANTAPSDASFVSVSCVASGTCQMLGEYLTNSPLGIVHSVVETYSFSTGLSSSIDEISQVSGEDGIGLSSISCATATTCVAVGAQAGQEAETATYVDEVSGAWGSPMTLENAQDGAIPEEFLSSISCVAAGDCVAAGNWISNSGNIFGETYTEQAGIWGAATNLAQPSNLGNPNVDDISCVSAVTQCTISGALTNDEGGYQPATAQMTSGRWGQFAPATPPVGATPDEEFLAISCVTGSCTAAGYYDADTQIGGTEAMAATWVPASPPGPVTALHVTSQVGQTVRLAWTSPSVGDAGSGISHYEIDAFLRGGAGSDVGPSNSTSATVSDLQPGGIYKINVTTVATDGQTSPASSVTVHIPATKPSAAAIKRIVGVKGALHVYWSAPKSTGGDPITSYKVTAACHGTVHTDHFGGTSLQGTVGGLGDGTVCTVRVYAINHVGDGPPSAPVNGKTLS